MTISKKLALVMVALLAFASPVFAAGFMKYDGVDGESKKTESGPSATQTLDSGETAKPAGLLLPAVQKVRSSAAKSETDKVDDDDRNSKKGKVEYNWKVEEGEK